jgi:hypothetical protein
MQAFRITTDDNTDYVSTLTLAKEAINAVPAPFRAAIVVDLVEVQSDKEGIIHALNGLPVITPLYRSWRGTARGGLTEVASTVAKPPCAPVVTSTTPASISGLTVGESASDLPSSITGD